MDKHIINYAIYAIVLIIILWLLKRIARSIRYAYLRWQYRRRVKDIEREFKEIIVSNNS